MDYQPYAKSAGTPSRKLRKSQRNSAFIANRKMAKLAKRPRGAAQTRGQ